MHWMAALRTRLLNDPGVTALVGDRVFLKRRAQGTALPAVVLTKVSDPRVQTLDGFQTRQQGRVQVDCWSEGGSGQFPKTRTEVEEIAAAVVAALAPAGTFHGVLFGRAMFDPARDLGEETETGFLHRDSFDLTVMHD